MGESFSRGPLAMADVDGDGALDVFIGGRVSAARYPEATTSLIVRNDNSRFVPFQRFEKLGLVSGATFSDLDGDGKPELIVACEWGPIRVFRKEGTQFIEITEKLGLGNFSGLWNGVATGDFDGDGKLDIVASNWGLNTKYRATREHPIRLYYGDINGVEAVDIVESHFDAALNKEVPDSLLKTASAAFPFLQASFPTHEAYSVASVHEIFGDKLKQCGVVEANTLASMVFLNRGDRFEGVALPAEAQFAAAFGISVADFDGDGNEDIFLSQNFFATAGDTARADAGRGLLLRGQGNGGFVAVSGLESGIAIYGEQRGCAVADFDRDGRVDLAVGQNGGATKLYHNTAALPGLRVRLIGSPQNAGAIGAVMRLTFASKQGPVREVRAGSGYWSQDCIVQTLAMPEAPRQILVRWPGGQTTTSDVPAGAMSIQVDVNGKVGAP
jgi:enediyne biosynthesis protein E4